MRSAPSKPKISPVEKLRGDLVAEEITYRFLTPVFGGGYETDGCKKPFDPYTPIRAPAIRGQLRFWWRACNPQKCHSTEDLFATEAAIFGSTTQQSKLLIRVSEQPAEPEKVQVFEDGKKFRATKGMSEIAYGAFPLRDTSNACQHGVLHRYRDPWSITCLFPESIESDVRAALWAWAHFGGLGGRTRRGFGAIEQLSRSDSLLSIKAGWGTYVGGIRVPWPHLLSDRHECLRTKDISGSTGIEAHKELLGALWEMRQGTGESDIGPGRRRGKGPRPGRSYWPEPDAIRRLTHKSAAKHKQPTTEVAAFPRAVFGMPIIFHFKDSMDPPDTTVVPMENTDRLSSPLIIRPHPAIDLDEQQGKMQKEQQGKMQKLALVLHGEIPEKAHLKFGNHPDKQKKQKEVAVKLTQQQAKTLAAQSDDGTPFSYRNGDEEPDPLKRFLEDF